MWNFRVFFCQLFKNDLSFLFLRHLKVKNIIIAIIRISNIDVNTMDVISIQFKYSESKNYFALIMNFEWVTRVGYVFKLTMLSIQYYSMGVSF